MYLNRLIQDGWLMLVCWGVCLGWSLPMQAQTPPLSVMLVVQANPSQEGAARLLKHQLETSLNLVSGLRSLDTAVLEQRAPDWLQRNFAPVQRPQWARDLHCQIFALIRLDTGSEGWSVRLEHYDARLGKSQPVTRLNALTEARLAPEVFRTLLLRLQLQPTAIQKQMIDRLLADAPGSQSLRAEAQLAEARGKTEAALAQINLALAQNPNSPAILAERAQINALSGDFGGAVADFSAALAQVPAWPEALYLRGLARSRLGQWPQVVQDFEAAYRIKPAFGPELACLLGKAAREQANGAQARNYFEQALVIQADYAPALQALGEWWLDQRSPAKALNYLEQGLKVASDDETRYSLLTARGIALTMLNRHAESTSTLTSAINLLPARPLAWYLRGLSRAIQGQCPQARQDWNKACGMGYPQACQQVCS